MVHMVLGCLRGEETLWSAWSFGCLKGETDINVSVKDTICGVHLGVAVVDLCLGEGQALALQSFAVGRLPTLVSSE